MELQQSSAHQLFLVNKHLLWFTVIPSCQEQPKIKINKNNNSKHQNGLWTIVVQKHLFSPQMIHAQKNFSLHVKKDKRHKLHRWAKQMSVRIHVMCWWQNCIVLYFQSSRGNESGWKRWRLQNNPRTQITCLTWCLPRNTWAARCSGSGSCPVPAPESLAAPADRVWPRSSRWTTSLCRRKHNVHQTY